MSATSQVAQTSGTKPTVARFRRHVDGGAQQQGIVEQRLLDAAGVGAAYFEATLKVTLALAIGSGSRPRHGIGDLAQLTGGRTLQAKSIIWKDTRRSLKKRSGGALRVSGHLRVRDLDVVSGHATAIIARLTLMGTLPAG